MSKSCAEDFIYGNRICHFFIKTFIKIIIYIICEAKIQNNDLYTGLMKSDRGSNLSIYLYNLYIFFICS